MPRNRPPLAWQFSIRSTKKAFPSTFVGHNFTAYLRTLGRCIRYRITLNMHVDSGVPPTQKSFLRKNSWIERTGSRILGMPLGFNPTGPLIQNSVCALLYDFSGPVLLFPFEGRKIVQGHPKAFIPCILNCLIERIGFMKYDPPSTIERARPVQ